MKKFLFLAFTFLTPSVYAVDYVKCEAIRAVISRNRIQQGEASKSARSQFQSKKVREKYGTSYCTNYGTAAYKECKNFEQNVFSNFADERAEYQKMKLEPYVKINTRATKDFEKNGCYWF